MRKSKHLSPLKKLILKVKPIYIYIPTHLVPPTRLNIIFIYFEQNSKMSRGILVLCHMS
jgi:hypothetical protein